MVTPNSNTDRAVQKALAELPATSASATTSTRNSAEKRTTEVAIQSLVLTPEDVVEHYRKIAIPGLQSILGEGGFEVFRKQALNQPDSDLCLKTCHGDFQFPDVLKWAKLAVVGSLFNPTVGATLKEVSSPLWKVSTLREIFKRYDLLKYASYLQDHMTKLFYSLIKNEMPSKELCDLTKFIFPIPLTGPSFHKATRVASLLLKYTIDMAPALNYNISRENLRGLVYASLVNPIASQFFQNHRTAQTGPEFQKILKSLPNAYPKVILGGNGIEGLSGQYSIFNFAFLGERSRLPLVPTSFDLPHFFLRISDQTDCKVCNLADNFLKELEGSVTNSGAFSDKLPMIIDLIAVQYLWSDCLERAVKEANIKHYSLRL